MKKSKFTETQIVRALKEDVQPRTSVAKWGSHALHSTTGSQSTGYGILGCKAAEGTGRIACTSEENVCRTEYGP